MGAESSLPIAFGLGTIPPGATVTLEIVLDDAASGRTTMTANAKTTSAEADTADNSASASIEVRGLSPLQSSLGIGSQAIGAVGPARTFTVVNQAAIPGQVQNALIGGGDFVVSEDGCSGTTPAAGASCPIGVMFAATALGSRIGGMTVSSTTAGISQIAVSLSGTGVPQPPVDTRGASLSRTILVRP